MSFQGEIANTYVQLITAPSSGINGTVKFHAQMTDASSGNFEEWGFFYKKSTTDVAVDTGNTISSPGGIIADNPQTLPGAAPDWFTRDVVVNAGRGDKYYFNAYLRDTNHQPPGTEYIFQNPSNEDTAPIGTSFIIPNVDQDAATIDTPFQATLNGKLEEDLYSNAFPFVEAGFDYKRPGDAWSAAITVGNASWNEVPATWTKTVQDLSNNQQYESRAWFKVKDQVATAPGTASDITIRGYESDDSQNETKTWTTQNQQVPTITSLLSNHQIWFYPDRDDLTDDDRYVSQRTKTSPIEITFQSKLLNEGDPETVAGEVGFFISKDSVSTKPDHNTSPSHNIVVSIAGGFGNNHVFNNDPKANNDANFPIPGQLYYMNAYAKDTEGDFSDRYYYKGDEEDWPPTGIKFQTPKVHLPSTPGEVVEITEAGTTADKGKATFSAVILYGAIYETNGGATSTNNKEGFVYWSETGFDAADALTSNSIEKEYPGHTEGVAINNITPHTGPAHTEKSWNNLAVSSYTRSITNIKWSERYWVRPYVVDNQLNVGTAKLETFFYATVADTATWEEGRSFYIPSVVTPLSSSGVEGATTFVLSASLSLVNSTGYLNGGAATGAAASPQIYQKGYYLKEGSSSFSASDRYIDVVGSNWYGNSGVTGWPVEDTTAVWGAITFKELTPNEIVYWYQPYALVYRYVGAGTGDLFEILGDTKQSFETLKPLVVENTPTTPPFIEVGAGSSSGMGEGKKFRNITVTGELVNSGGGTAAVAEIGFFLSSGGVSGPNFVSNQDQYSLNPVPAEADPSDRELKTPATVNANQTNEILYEPGTTYYVNFYASPQVTGGSSVANDYYYDGGQNSPQDPAPDFQIPDVRNSTIFFTSESEMKLRGVVVKGDDTSYPNDNPGPMVPAQYGFVYNGDESATSGEIFPHQGTSGGDTDILIAGTTSDWDDLVDDSPTQEEFKFEHLLNTNPGAGNGWPPVRGFEYFINAFVKDDNNTIYYPLKDQYISFMIPDPEYSSKTTPTPTSITLTGTLNEYANYTPGAKKGPYIDNYGFIYDETEANLALTPPVGARVNKTSGNQTSFESAITGLDGNTTYYFRAFVEVFERGNSGGPFTMTSETTENFKTLPDFGTVQNIDPEFVTGYKIRLKGIVLGLGSGAQESTKMGFFIHKTDDTPGVDNYNASPPNPPFNDTHEVSPMATGSNEAFSVELDFQTDFPPEGVAAVAGETYYINAWVNDPTYANETGQVNQKSGYRYDGGGNTPPTGVSITLPNLIAHPTQIPPNTLQDVTNPPPAASTNFNVNLFGTLDAQPKIGTNIASSAKVGFFVNTTQNPGPTSTIKPDTVPTTSTTDYSLVAENINGGQIYYFNPYVYDGQNYYYIGIGTGGSWSAGPPDGVNLDVAGDFKLPAVGIDPITDISGDAVHVDANNTALLRFTITHVGLFLNGALASQTSPAVPAGINSWSITKGPPLDTNPLTLGGGIPYSAQGFIKIDGVSLLSADTAFSTHTWPVITYKDISRNVTSLAGDNTGFILMETQVKSFGLSNAAISLGPPTSTVGFYIGDTSGIRSGEAPLITKFDDLEQATTAYDSLQSSEDTGTYLDRGKLYYSNTFVSQQCPPDPPGVSEPDNYQYYGFFHRPSYPQVGPPTLDASCTTLARANAGGTFPDGISFIIPDITNQDPEIIDSSTVKLKLYLDSSGHTVDVPGTDTLGFFFNHTDNPGADASCNNQTFVDFPFQTDVSNVLIPEGDPWGPGSNNKFSSSEVEYSLDASGLKPGQNYYYTGYTAQLDTGSRGEGVDEDDYWYPPKYDQKDSSDVVKTFCIGDSSCNPIPSNKSLNETTLVGKTIGSPPNPYDNEHGFVYWFDGSNNYDNRKFLTPPTAPPGEWPPIELEGLKDSTRYYALPYFKQGTNYILGGLHDHGGPSPGVFENHPTIWYTDLSTCKVGLNDISGVEFGNDNGGSLNGEGGGAMTDDDSGSQTRYKIERIDASLNRNPPDNFKDEVWTEDCTREDCSGTVVELGLCWKVTDDPLGVGKATVSNFHKNLLYDGSYNGWRDVNQMSSATPGDVLKDASYNIYDASINDLSYNTMYSLRTYAKNEPIIDTTVVAGAEQGGGGYGYSKTITSNIAGWFITPLPKVIIEDPSAAQVPLENPLSENPNVPSYAPKIFTKIGISGEILDNPDEASGNIIEYGFLMKMFTPATGAPTTPVYGSFDNSNCDISSNLLGESVSFNEDSLWDQEVGPYEFFQDFSLYPEDGVKDLSYNRQYYFGSYARNKSEHYLGLELVTDAISNGEEAYIEPSGVIRYEKKNDSSGVLITPWPAPYIKILDLDKPSNLTGASEYTFVNVSLEIFNYDPTKWGGIAEFGVIWEKNKILLDSNISPNSDDFTMQYMDGSGAWLVGADGSGGWYRRGCSGEFLTDFVELEGEMRPGESWTWPTTPDPTLQGWQYDASFSSGGFPDGNENESCRWPPTIDKYIKLGVYRLGLSGPYENSLIDDHKPSPAGSGSAQDPSSIPFNTEEGYWLRPYIITRNKGFWKPTDENGNPRNDSNGAHPDSSFNIFYGPAKNLTFDLDLVGVETGHARGPTGEILRNWSAEGYTGTAGGEWPTMEDVGIDSVDMSGNITSNPLIGDPTRGRIVKYGFLWWDGGKTATEGQGALQWPGQEFGFGPKTAAGESIPNLGFTLANTAWPPDGSNNYCVLMDEHTQENLLDWNSDAEVGGANHGRTTFDLSGTNFDISANDFVRAGQDGGQDGEGYGDGGISVASESGYYWNSHGLAIDDGWYQLPFPLGNPPWPGADAEPPNPNYPKGYNDEAAIIISPTVIFDVKETARLGTSDRRLFNSTVWYRAYAINKFFNPESGDGPQVGYNYGTVGRLELKKSVNFGVDMVNPVLASSNIGTRSILVTGSLLGNRDGQGNPIVENYGFCWRKLIENHPKDDDGHLIPDAEREPSWYYDASGTPPLGWATRYQSFPPPTVIDSSMVALGLRDDGKIWDDGEPIPLDEYNASNVEVSGFDASGEFPGETPNPLFNGFTQNPPSFKFGSRVWNFHYKIGSDGKELEAEGGVKDSDFVGFDASGGKLTSNTYYLIRAWVKGPIDPGTLEDDDGETASGIKYGPIWYINADNREENKQRGWLALTRPLELCSLDDISKKKLTYKSVILKSKLLTNPDPSRLNKYGFVFMLDDASGNGLPTLEDNQYVLLNLPTDLNDLAAPPAKVMEKKISILPNSYYTVRAFADNSFESYISYDNSGNPEGSSTKEGGVVYSNPYTILSDFCPPPESKIISATDASYVSVQLRGEILNNFNGLISEHGFIVGEETMPIINDGSSYKYDLGSKNNLGHFTHFAIGLKYNTTYFARSFAYHPASHEDLRLQYGSHVLTFQTLNPDSPEIISTKQMKNGRGSVSATFGSEIKDTSGIELLSSYGFCWTTRIVPLSSKAEYTGNNEPLDSELKIENADNYSEYTNLPDTFPFYFETILTNLQPSTTYYIRSYAKINPIGYGEVYKFTTLDEPCDCLPPTTKPIGALHPNKSSKMLCAEAIKRHGSAIIGTRGVTPNLL